MKLTKEYRPDPRPPLIAAYVLELSPEDKRFLSGALGGMLYFARDGELSATGDFCLRLHALLEDASL